MLLQRSLLETVTIISCSGTLICILLHYATNISLISGIWFPVYVSLMFLASVTLSFKFIQKLLHLNKPLKYDVEGLAKDYPYLKFFWDVLPRVPTRVVSECKEYDTNELSVISTVLERRLVSSWYVQYVSQEIGFPFGCKQMLDQMIGTTFQICNKAEPKDVYVDICSVLITHLKEYKKALKRHQKSPETSIESLYKKTHLVSIADKKLQSAEHCTNVLRIILKELVPWELWDTPQSELLVRILSKKLDNFIDSTLSDPVWLNDMLMSILEGKITEAEPIVEEPEETVKTVPPQVEVPVSEPVSVIETATIASDVLSTSPVVETKASTVIDEEVQCEKPEEAVQPSAISAPVEIKSSPVLRQRRGRQGREQVKIYDRIIEGSVKTWDTDTDLQCISMGQDLLESLNGDEITLNRLWGQDPQDSDAGSKDSRLWFNEEETTDLDLDSKEVSPVKKETSPKPTDALLKDIQSTVHQAKSKIGDLQVAHVAVPVNDEAAGMMEGLLDFGIAGLKKGLRLTGLGDDSQELSAPKEKNTEKTSPVTIRNALELKEPSNTVLAVQKEENGNTVPPLLKQQRVSSQDSMASLPKPPAGEQPALAALADSPEPEYEEAADLSTSIAKLRCLLQQRADNASGSDRDSDDIWWEGAEETRGRAQRHHSGRVDPAALADQYDMSSRSPPQGNNMQRLDRLFQRTVTGVFNSIKTVVGAEGDADGRTLHDWTYVCTSIELSVGGAVSRLVGAERARGRGRTLAPLRQPSPPLPPAPPALDLPEELEEWCGARGAGWSAAVELAAAAGTPRTALSHRIATLLCADIAESLIEVYLDAISSWLRTQVFAAFERLAHRKLAPAPRLRSLCLDDTCKAIVDKLPAAVLIVFGEEAVQKAVQLSVASLSHQTINRDVVFRLLDVLARHFKHSAGVRSPSFDNN